MTDSVYSFEIEADPSTLCTAQQKKVSFYSRRIFTNPKVARTKKIVSLLARRYKDAVRVALSSLSPDDGIRLEATYFYAYPKSTAKKRLIDNAVKNNGADCDNVHKAVQDALGFDKGRGANLWDDDRRISTLVVRKRYTLGTPRIRLSVSPDV